MRPAILRGITWNHIRGFGPLDVTAAEYSLKHPDVEIVWERRSLQAFADHPIDDLAATYDLLMIDHPWAGRAAASGAILPLDQHLGTGLLDEQAAHSVGLSHPSYNYAGHQWALAADAAAQVSAFREDLLEARPATWAEVVDLARDTAQAERGRVAVPLIPVDCYCSFSSLYANHRQPPFVVDWPLDPVTVQAVLELMRDIVAAAHPLSLDLNPPRLLELMSTTDEISYAPLTFGYNNYSRRGYRTHIVRFGDIPSAGKGPVGSILGGVGIAVSASSRGRDHALRYAKYVVSPAVQKEIYLHAGGQPGSAAAWEDGSANALTNDFFRSTRATMEGAHVRPRHDGFLRVQEQGGLEVHRYLRGERTGREVFEALNQMYEKSLASR